MRLFRYLLLALALLSLRASVPASADEMNAAYTGDKRFDQKLDIKAIGVPLNEFLAKLAARTGVKLTCQKNVADDKVFVQAHQLTLSKLTDSLEKVLHLQCARSGQAGAYQYVFVQPPNAKQEAKQIRAEAANDLRAFIQKLPAEFKLSQAQHEKKYGKDGAPVIFNPITKAVVEIYSSLPSKQKTALWNNRQLILKNKYLTRSDKSKLVSALNAEDAIFMEQEKNDKSVPKADLDDMAMSKWVIADSIYLTVEDNPLTGAALAVTIVGKGEDKKADGKTEGNSSTNSFWILDFPKYTKTSDIESARNASPDSPMVNVSAGQDAYHALEQIADQAKISIVSDYFTQLDDNHFPGAVNAVIQFPVTPAVQTYANEVGAGILDSENVKSAAGYVYLIVNRNWPVAREMEIPQRLLDRWNDAKTRKGALDVFDYAEISQLNKLQLNRLVFYGLGNGDNIYSDRMVLRFIASLTESQRKEALSKKGLPVSDITRHQLGVLYNSEKEIAAEPGMAHDWPLFTDNGKPLITKFTLRWETPSRLDSSASNPEEPEKSQWIYSFSGHEGSSNGLVRTFSKNIDIPDYLSASGDEKQEVPKAKDEFIIQIVK